MYFGFDEHELDIRDAVRAMLAASCPASVVRAAWEAPPGALDRKVWRELTAMGVPSLMVPESGGGLGLDERSLVLVLEEIGYAGLAAPVVESTLVATTFVGGSDDLFGTNLGGPYVPMAADTDRLLLRHTDGSVHVLSPTAVELTPVPSTDRSRRLAAVEWEPGENTLVCDEPERIDLALDRATFGTAATLVGLLQRLLDMTVEYVGGRRQFGVPIGSFQAVKHHLADALTALQFARPAVHRAAWSLATDSADRSRDVSLAKLLTSDAARTVTRQALQCHGAIGYTVEYDLHLFMKRAWALDTDFGDAREHRRRIGRLLRLDDAATEAT